MIYVIIGMLYIFIGVLVFSLMLYLQKEKGIDFEIDNEYLFITLILNMFFWPLILLVLFPYILGKHYLNK
jgi:hypothetical protein